MDYNLEPTTIFSLSHGFVCSSSDVINSVFDDIGRTIDTDQGLKKITISGYEDRNTLDEWPLSQLAIKSPNLESLIIAKLSTTIANRSQLLEFAGIAATNSTCLHTLELENTRCSTEDGDKLM